MKRALCTFLVFAVMLIFSASAAALTDALGREIVFDAVPERVVALLGSYGECWIAAGGTLAGTTEDAVNAPGARAQGGVVNLGNHSAPDLERLLSLDPDFVILSADTAAHVNLGALLESAGIPCGYFSMLDYRGYMALIADFAAVTGRDDLLAAQEAAVLRPIEEAVARAQAHPDYGTKTVLLLRAYVTSVRAKDSESTVAGPILRDLGLVNLADGSSPLRENLSMEAIMEADPDYIFAVTMGADEEGAVRMLEETLLSNPAWATLTAVREGRFFLLERDLFHYRPNGRWAEAYARIEEILYGAPE